MNAPTAVDDQRFERMLANIRDARTTNRSHGELTEDATPSATRGNESNDATARDLTVDGLIAAISERVLHQPAAVHDVARILSARLGVARLNPQRPHAFLLATGPTGTGKSTLAAAVAGAVYGDVERLIRVDCSELTTPASVSSIVGPPPGYVGFDRPDGWLTTRVECLGSGVVIFDEIEKADPAIWTLLLQIAEGRLSDATGRTVSFASTTVILTANVGAAEAARRPAGFVDRRNDPGALMADAVSRTFPPELLGRLDATLVFHQLPAGAGIDLAHRTWCDYQRRMQRNGWNLDLDRTVLHAALGNVDLHTTGARELERTIEFDVLAGLNNLQPGSYRAELTTNGVEWHATPDTSHHIATDQN